jgi:hypothetical protein
MKLILTGVQIAESNHEEIIVGNNAECEIPHRPEI